MNRRIYAAYHALRNIVVFAVPLGLLFGFMTTTAPIYSAYYIFDIIVLTGCCVTVIACVIARMYLGSLLQFGQEEIEKLEKQIKAGNEKFDAEHRLKIEISNQLNLFSSLVRRACFGMIDSEFLRNLAEARQSNDVMVNALDLLLILLMQGTAPLDERRRILIETFLPQNWKEFKKELPLPPGATAPEAQSE